MKTRSRQEMFDIVAVHLIEQREKSRANSMLCVYRGPHGLRCAVGVLMSNKDYRAQFEEESLSSAEPHMLSKMLHAARCSVDHLGFLVDLQQLHDSSDVENWPEELVGVAEKNGLDLTALADALEQL